MKTQQVDDRLIHLSADFQCIAILGRLWRGDIGLEHQRWNEFRTSGILTEYKGYSFCHYCIQMSPSSLGRENRNENTSRK